MLADIVIPAWLQPFILTILAAISTLVVALVGLLVAKVNAKLNLSEAESEGIRALGDGVLDIQKTYVDEIKTASADGVLTPDEMETARLLAVNKALSVAKGAGAQFLATLTRERLTTLIETILAKFKTSGVIAK